MAVTGLPALSAEQAVLSVTLMCARTHSPASQPGVLQLPGMAVTGLPALSAAHAVLSVTLVGLQRHTRASPPGGLRVQGEVMHGVLAWSGAPGGGTVVVISGTSLLLGVPAAD